jgi:hypothetical protein
LEQSNGDGDWLSIDGENDESSNDSIQNKGNKRRSAAWQYFEIVECIHKVTKKKELFVKCMVDCEGSKCGKKLKYHNSTKYLFSHLENSHKIFQGKVKDTSDSNNKNDIEFLNYNLMMFIITAALPFRCVENEYFKKFVKALNSSNKLPDRKNISKSAKSHHDKIKEKLKRELEPIEHIALTSDGWTSRQNYSYLGVTCHYLNSNFQICHFNLAVRHFLGGHNAENITKCIKNIICEYKIESKISFIVTDNAANIINAVEKLKFKSLRCFGHILNLIVTSTFKSIKETLKNRETQSSIELFNYDFSCCDDDNIDIKLALESIDSKVKNLLNQNIAVLENFDTG